MIENAGDVANELRRSSAAMGMVFFGLRYGKTVANLEDYVVTGMSVCDIIIKGRSVPQSAFPRYEDRAVRDAFVRVATNRQLGERLPDQEQEMVNRAEVARRTLQQLRDHESVSEQDLDQSAEFFRSVCKAM
jgi:hypothetical protein